MDTEIVVYSTPTCPHCVVAKQYLKEKGISFVEHNVAQDKKAAMEMMRKTNQMSVPVIVVGDEVVIGFNRPLLDELLKD